MTTQWNKYDHDDPKTHPTIPGTYAVMVAGDSETDGAHVFYEYGDYQTFASLSPMEEGHQRFSGDHDEEPEQFMAWFGPIIVPSCDCLDEKNELKEEKPALIENACFFSFKVSGKWYATGRGYLPQRVFEIFDREERRNAVVAANGSKYPGLSSSGDDFIFVIVPDADLDYGFPLMLHPNDNWRAMR